MTRSQQILESVQSVSIAATGADDASEWLDGPAVIAQAGDDDAGSQYRLGSREYPWHRHVRGQVACVETGMAQIRTQAGAWLLPPGRACWIPAGTLHQGRVRDAATGWSLLITPRAARRLPAEPCVIGISELLSSLVRRAQAWDARRPLTPAQARIARVILDELCAAPHEALHLPMPASERLATLARALMDEPGDRRTLEAWAGTLAMSASTLRRRVSAETGMTFGRWRQQIQLVHALERLVNGASVADVAHALGYATPSNFIAMFRQAFGATPARYATSHRRTAAAPVKCMDNRAR
ncbi:AraC family transcriptional regulator [Achromobacter aloeverae]